MDAAPTPTVRKRRKPLAIEPGPAGTSPASAANHELAASIACSVEAILFSVDRPVPASRLAHAVLHAGQSPEDADAPCSKEDESLIERVVALLNAEYERSGRSFRVEGVSGGYRVMTLPEHADAVASFKRARLSTRLTRAAIETLAIIAYRQPVTRAELESIRGVACGEVLKSLMDRRLVTIKGRAEELGRPMLYGTSKQFLDHFGLASIKDLPQVADLRIAPSDDPAHDDRANSPKDQPTPDAGEGAQE